LTHLPDKPLELQLLNELQRGETLYRRTLTQLQQSLPDEDHSAEEIAACLARLEPAMERIQSLENTLAPLRQAWARGPRRAGAELKTLLGNHEQLLKGLIERMDALEQQMQRHRRQAIPGLDQVVRHQQMQRAYQQGTR